MKIFKNNNKRSSNFILTFSHSTFFLVLVMFLFISIALEGTFTYSFGQNLSNTISLKANAGEDQYVEEGQPVILNAEDSTSSDLPIDIFRWFQVEPRNPLIDLENGDSQKASFIAPNLPREQYFVFQLIVKDANVTDTDTVNIYVVEDLASINTLKDSSSASYQPEICYDGSDNDLDGEIDLQDKDCGMRILQNSPTQVPNGGGQEGLAQSDPYLEGQAGQVPYDPYSDTEQGGLPLQPGQLPQSQPQQQQQQSPSQPNPGPTPPG